MQLYLESADPDTVREAMTWSIVDGVATSPPLLARAAGSSEDLVKELCGVVNGPVFVDVTSTDSANMIEEAQLLASLDDRVIVRIPCSNTGIPAISALAQQRITVEAGLCFSLSQALLAAKAGARLVSPAVGAMDAAGGDGLALLGAMMTMLDQYEMKASVHAGGLEHPGHVAEAARMGADGATVSLDLLGKLADHPLTHAMREGQLDQWRRAQN